MLRPLILDGRDLLNGDEMLAMEFEYQGVGIPIPEAGKTKVNSVSSGNCAPA